MLLDYIAVLVVSLFRFNMQRVNGVKARSDQRNSLDFITKTVIDTITLSRVNNPTVAVEASPFDIASSPPRYPPRRYPAYTFKCNLLPEVPEPTSAPAVLVPVTVRSPAPRAGVSPPRIVVSPPQRTAMPGDKPDSGLRVTLEDRDPNSLNQHVQIVWDDIIGEPEGARSPECAWRVSRTCFVHARDACYTLLAVLAAPPCALLLGCGFACLAFEQIWCSTPCLRCLKIYFASLRSLVQACMAATVAPAMEALGHVCRHIRVNYRQDAPEDRDLLVI